MPKFPLGYFATRLALTHEYGEDKLITVTALYGDVDYEALKDSLKTLFDRYQVLRCTLHKNHEGYFLLDNLSNFKSIEISHNVNPSTSWKDFIQSRLGENSS